MKKQFLALANEVEDGPEAMLGLPNEVAISEDGWALISPYGDFPHAAGMQRVTQDAANAMVKDFKSFWGRIRRAVVGCPIYKGHPDCPALTNQYPDKAVHGMFADLQARPDGLYGKPVLHPTGADLVEKRGLKFLSPYWIVQALENESRPVYVPVRLKSVGLTDRPNIPGPSLTNEQNMNKAILIALLGLANEASDAQIETAIADLKAKAGRVSALENEAATLRTGLANETAAKAALAAENTTLKAGLANERTTKAKATLDAAVLAGRITAAERPIWEGALANEAAFDTTVAALNALAPRIKTQGKTENLGARKEALANAADRMSQVQQLVQAKVAAGMNYDAAYAAVHKENPALFTAQA